MAEIQKKESRLKDKTNLRYQRDKDREKVRGIFRFYEVPGGSIAFSYKAYKEDPVEKFDLVDGQIFTLPLGVARHLNKNGVYPVHQHAVDASGNPIVEIGTKVHRFGFQSLEFVDLEDFGDSSSEIVQATPLTDLKA